MHSSHLHKVVSTYYRTSALDVAVRKLKALDTDYPFHAIIGRGISGIAFGAILAHLLNKDFGVVRKGESTHGRTVSELPTCFVPKQSPQYVIVDDLIASGATIKAIREGVETACPTAQCVGIYLYQDADVGSIHDASTAELLYELNLTNRILSDGEVYCNVEDCISELRKRAIYAIVQKKLRNKKVPARKRISKSRVN